MLMGIDIGGTKTAVVALGPDGSVVAERRAPSGHGPDGVVAVALAVAHECADAVGGWTQIASVGACMPGLVDPRSGLVTHALNLGVDALPLGPALSDALSRPVVIDNDVKGRRLGCLPVAWRGPGHGLRLPQHRYRAGRRLGDQRPDRPRAGRDRRGDRSPAFGRASALPLRPDRVSGDQRIRLGAHPDVAPRAAPCRPVRRRRSRRRPGRRGGAPPLRWHRHGHPSPRPRRRGSSTSSSAAASPAWANRCLLGSPRVLAQRAAQAPLLDELTQPGRFSMLSSDVPIAALGAARLPSAAAQLDLQVAP
jgi:hypothetical protein